VVVFVPAVFKAQYTEFATVADAALNLNFTLATLVLNNSCRSAVIDANVRETLLNLLVAHITALRNGVSGQPPQGIVGRINTATEGTVSVGAEFLTLTASQAWYVQTQSGAMFWQATASYRGMHYVPGPRFGSGVGVGGWPGRCDC